MLEMKILKKDNNLSVMILEGRLDAYGASIFEEKLKELNDSENKLILNFEKVVFLSSAGIRALLTLYKNINKKNGIIVITKISNDVNNAIEMSGMEKFFEYSDNEEEALKYINSLTLNTSVSDVKEINNKVYNISKLNTEGSLLDIWSGKKTIEPAGLVRAGLDTLEILTGIGGFGSNENEASEMLGEFISTGTFAAVLPADEHCITDFIIPKNPSDATVFLYKGIGISGKPSYLLKDESETISDLSSVINDIKETVCKDNTFFGFVIQAKIEKLMSGYYKNKNDILNNTLTTDETSIQTKDKFVTTSTQTLKINSGNKENVSVLIIGTAIDKKIVDSSKQELFSDFADYLKQGDETDSLLFHSHSIIYSGDDIESDDLNLLLKKIANLDILKSVSHIKNDTKLGGTKIWVYQPQTIRNGKDKLIKIEYPKDIIFHKEWEVIVRKIYHDSSKVVLTPLQGGFSSATFSVESYDKEGRKNLPTVVKIGPKELTNREVNAYKSYVEKFILNNSTTIMGIAECGNWAGLRYNFVGITGSSGSIIWLENLYKTLPVYKIIQIFDRIYTDILKPWYGQPKWESIKPYELNDPGHLFNNLLSDAETNLNINPDNETIDCPELGITLPNPFHFYKYEWQKRKSKLINWYLGICHCDLNMKNILLDDKENIYIIDFSESRITNIVSDFARLEPIVLFELTKLENENDLIELLKFIQNIYSIKKINDFIKFDYTGNDPMVEKAYKIICIMRKYADKITLFETNPEPYFTAVLEWMMPVISYGSASKLQKKLAVYTAAFIIKELIKL
jgi:anti-anti-sigma factor